MSPVIRSIFIDPPIAIARLGGSNTPQDAYLWVESPDPRSDGETTIAPTWSLTVLADGSVEPQKPDAVVLRDGPLIRPVCPFFEIWALMGEPGSAPETWTEAPLTPALLAQHRLDESAVTARVDAHNLKAARRTGNPNLGFGTFPPVEIKGDNHDSVVLFATSPTGARPPMIPKGRNIPLGSVQIMRSRPNPPNADFRGEVDVEILRLRFTPGRGRFYGPPAAATAPRQPPFPAVDANNAFLEPRAGWAGARMPASLRDVIQPGDTYDGAEQGSGNQIGPALGVVDDTCEARIEVTLTPRSGDPMKAFANVFAGPPDFGPDRRPFLSLADELNDRAADASARSAAMSPTDRNDWVEDLFERIYETVSLLNVDFYRRQRGITLTGSRLTSPGIAGEQLRDPRRAMGAQDALRNPNFPIPGETPGDPLPLSTHARTRHRALADLQYLRDFIAQNPRPRRMAELVRQPFEVERSEDGDGSTMRMPPFMRQSNAEPLTLSVWQYDLLMQWVAAITAIKRVALEAVAVAPQPAPLSEPAARRRSAVLARLAAAQGGTT